MINRTWTFPAKYLVINPDHLSGGVGDRSPKRLHYVRTLIAAMIGDYLQEGLKIFDYGCGPGWLANMLSGKLKDFTYWGMEPDVSAHQKLIVQHANNALGHDPRVTFGHLGGELEQEVLTNADVVYFGSIFTHLTFEHFKSVIQKVRLVVDRGGLIVFDCFLDEKEKYNTPWAYGCRNCYGTAYYIEKKVKDFFRELGLDLEMVMGIMAHGGHFHYNFRVTRRMK